MSYLCLALLFKRASSALGRFHASASISWILEVVSTLKPVIFKQVGPLELFYASKGISKSISGL